MTHVSVFHWHKTFSEGRECVVNEHQTGKHSTSKSKVLMNTAAVSVHENCCTTVCELANALLISKGSAHATWHANERAAMDFQAVND
jgi:prophage maintenance system killer protein